MPKPTSSPTRCSVRKVSVTNQSKPGKTKKKTNLENRHLEGLNRIDGEPMEFEWKIFLGFITLGILEEIQKKRTELKCEPETFQGRIIIMSMSSDFMWRERGNTEKCEMNSVTVENCARRFLLGRWSFLGLGSEKKWYGTYSDKLDGDWDKTSERMMLNFAERCHPIFRLRPGKRRIKKQTGKKCIHFNGSEENIELILRTIISVNRLSICGAVADLCKELSKDSEAARKPAANEDLESTEIPT